MRYVSLEAAPINLLVTQLNKSPVLRESYVTCIGRNRRGVDDMSQDTILL